MKILIIANGEVGAIQEIGTMLPTADYIICADGGLLHAKRLGLTPNLIIGDFDSLPLDVLEEYKRAGIPIRQYSRDKDRTDTHIAVDIAIEMKATHVTLLGAFGNRFDHSYANLMMLFRLEKRNIKAQIIDSHNIVMMSNEWLEIKGTIGQVVSLLPFGCDVYIRSTQGLKYPIVEKSLYLDFPYGVSNVLSETRATVNIGAGWVIAVKAKD